MTFGKNWRGVGLRVRLAWLAVQSWAESLVGSGDRMGRAAILAGLVAAVVAVVAALFAAEWVLS